MSKWLLSVDGGGTATEYCIADEEGNVQFSVFTGSTSIKSVGNAAALANIQEGLRAIRGRGVEIEDISCGIWGMSGCDTPEDELVYQALLGTAGLPSCHYVVNDAMLAYWSSASLPGMVVVCGTGSAVTGLDSFGNNFRIGGWNYIYSDLGSGYWIGRRLLRETALWLDQCQEADPVYQRVLQQAAPLAKNPQESLYTISKMKDPGHISALAEVALNSTDSPISAKIRDEAAAHLMTYMKSMYCKLTDMGEKDLKIVLHGGLFKSDVFRQELIDAIHAQWGDSIPVIHGTISPVMGGIRLALMS